MLLVLVPIKVRQIVASRRSKVRFVDRRKYEKGDSEDEDLVMVVKNTGTDNRKKYPNVPLPTSVGGIILPSSDRRPDAPDAYALTIEGDPNYHKGHLMAYQLGAPHTGAIIVAQDGDHNTGKGSQWAKMEDELSEEALKVMGLDEKPASIDYSNLETLPSHALYYHAHVIYGRNNVPKQFNVLVNKCALGNDGALVPVDNGKEYTFDVDTRESAQDERLPSHEDPMSEDDSTSGDDHVSSNGLVSDLYGGIALMEEDSSDTSYEPPPSPK